MEPAKNNSLPLVIGFALVLVVGGDVYLEQSKTPVAPVDQGGGASKMPGGDTSGTTTPSDGSQTGTYAMTEIAKHDSESSCWTVIDAGVYDLTTWISQHPGGPGAILGICGKDGTSAFRGQHGNAQKQENILATFKIGTLVQ